MRLDVRRGLHQQPWWKRSDICRLDAPLNCITFIGIDGHVSKVAAASAISTVHKSMCFYDFLSWLLHSDYQQVNVIVFNRSNRFPLRNEVLHYDTLPGGRPRCCVTCCTTWVKNLDQVRLTDQTNWLILSIPAQPKVSSQYTGAGGVKILNYVDERDGIGSLSRYLYSNTLTRHDCWSKHRSHSSVHRCWWYQNYQLYAGKGGAAGIHRCWRCKDQQIRRWKSLILIKLIKTMVNSTTGMLS